MQSTDIVAKDIVARATAGFSRYLPGILHYREEKIQNVLEMLDLAKPPYASTMCDPLGGHKTTSS